MASLENRNQLKVQFLPYDFKRTHIQLMKQRWQSNEVFAAKAEIRPSVLSSNPLQMAQPPKPNPDPDKWDNTFSRQAQIDPTSANTIIIAKPKLWKLHSWHLFFRYLVWPFSLQSFFLDGMDDFTCLQPQWLGLKDCVCLEIKFSFRSIILPLCGFYVSRSPVLSRRHEFWDWVLLASPLIVMAEWEFYSFTTNI